MEKYFTDSEGKYHSVYKITDLMTGKFYIGKHSGYLSPEFDTYICSSSNKDLWNLIHNYPERLLREILGYYGSSIEAYEAEEELLPTDRLHYLQKKNLIFNKIKGGIPGWSGLSPLDRIECTNRRLQTNVARYGHPMGPAYSPEVYAKIGESSRLTKIELYGGAMVHANSLESQEKRKETYFRKYGVRGFPNCNRPEVKEKIAVINRKGTYKIDLNTLKYNLRESWTVVVNERECARDWINAGYDPNYLYVRVEELGNLSLGHFIVESKFESRSHIITLPSGRRLYFVLEVHERMYYLFHKRLRRSSQTNSEIIYDEEFMNYYESIK